MNLMHVLIPILQGQLTIKIPNHSRLRSVGTDVSQFDLEVVRSKRTVSPVQPKANPYTCQGNTYVWPIDLDAITNLYTGDTPNPNYPFCICSCH